ncbi:CHAD domain-containing protein [Sphingomonas sp. BT-65]|uniref:CHAD domain-containing protein n=1 Tax=Sphingomonas sp. BT-65 TaxID=2989821 RepID=UPI00223571DE|nr:CHAD domain-containing protein [Sphingomonas sp. BT-65]MCW4463684.1 CHAD domain-containing protein [Sphingomonas sp. BT-65]
MAYSVKPGDRTAQAALRRIACSQIDRAIAEINAPELSRGEVVHRLRRRTKKLRALLRLVRPHFDRYAPESAGFRDMARLLSTSRDATVIRHTLERLLRAWDSRALPGDVARLRPLVSDGGHAETAENVGAALSTVRERLGAARERVTGWALDSEGLDALADGLTKSYRRARKAMAAAEAKPVAGRLHEWRKRVKDHGFHRRLLRRALPHKLHAGLAQLDELAELLGDLHDLAMLRERVYAAGDAPPRAARTRLVAAIDRRERALTARSFDVGARLFHRKPKAMAHGVRRRLAAMRHGEPDAQA